MDTLKVSEDGIGTKRVLWIDEAGRVNDKWDVYLLDAANEATAWLTARSLDLCANQLNASVCQLGRETTTSELTVGLCMSTGIACGSCRGRCLSIFCRLGLIGTGVTSMLLIAVVLMALWSG